MFHSSVVSKFLFNRRTDEQGMINFHRRGCLLNETKNDQLVAIFFSSIRTAQNNNGEEIVKKWKAKRKKGAITNLMKTKRVLKILAKHPMEIDHSLFICSSVELKFRDYKNSGTL